MKTKTKGGGGGKKGNVADNVVSSHGTATPVCYNRWGNHRVRCKAVESALTGVAWWRVVLTSAVVGSIPSQVACLGCKPGPQ